MVGALQISIIIIIITALLHVLCNNKESVQLSRFCQSVIFQVNQCSTLTDSVLDYMLILFNSVGLLNGVCSKTKNASPAPRTVFSVSTHISMALMF